ncbi:bifunctional riboflavin kinase/FAD synthetase [Persephonella sp. KM09-Lau-8]|uniref:bifunctional riboflavin kinase/FAD synthetase n=1 Tax=Persephonella sp. KM09-Lau-8 TaxID=1158345 RepID=UPI00056BFCAD|nr:bifunctional riboflavin kinase/FAD synthetase [Persephonella sp. KM09-Lau-8]
MKVLTEQDLPLKEETVCTIGSFDGFHIGHIHLLEKTKEEAKRTGRKSLVITFEPHPKKILSPQNAPCRITDLTTKLELLRYQKIDYVYVIHFTKEYAKKPAEEFLDFLTENLRCKKIIVGHDWRFGYGGKGCVEFASEYGKKAGFEVEVIPPIKIDRTRISSTEIRKLLKEGRVDEAEKYLGRTYCIKGKVIKGDRLGQKIGFPTINIIPDVDLCLKKGVYMGYVSFDHKLYPAVINYGTRPTVDGKKTFIEAHIIGEKLEKDIKEVKIFFKRFIREEKKFNNIQELQNQIKNDIQKAINALEVKT